MPPALSFVVPMYNAAATIAALVHDIEQLEIEGGHEIVLVNDGGSDNTMEICRDLVRTARVPVTVIEHARNFGEHNAVLTGWRHALGEHIVNLDDDGQNPPREAVRLWQHAKATGVDVVFGHYETKQHSVWRNLGSWLTNRVTDLALDKPPGIVVHPAYKNVTGTVMNALLWRARQWPPSQRPSLVGRLDKDTSGIVLVARTAVAHAALQRAMAAANAEKAYLAVV